MLIQDHKIKFHPDDVEESQLNLYYDTLWKRSDSKI